MRSSILLLIISAVSSVACSNAVDLSSPEATLSGYIDSLRKGNVEGVLDRYHDKKEFHISRPIPIEDYVVTKKLVFGAKEVEAWNKAGIVPKAELGDVELDVKETIDSKEQMYSYNFRNINGSWMLIAHVAWGTD